MIRRYWNRHFCLLPLPLLNLSRLSLLLMATVALRAQTSENLGRVSLPVSCTAESQANLERGLAFMHSFQYPSAAPVFASVTEKEPQCAMGWWGQAINLYHQLWDLPDSAALKKGHELMLRAQASGPVTARERMYIDAAAAYFDAQPKLTLQQRLERYTEKMAALRLAYPQDVEAGSLYALALISTYQPESDAARKQAIAILQELFARAPDHPGVDHYLIHATDTREFAAQGLPAAQRYAITAPASSHALHMPSHIFGQLGMWQEMIDSNRAAADSAAEAARRDSANGADYQLHPMQYLHYAYMQTARDDEARELAASLKDVPAIEPDAVIDEGLVMRCLYVMEAHQWQAGAELDEHAPTVPFVQVRVEWAKAISAAHLGDRKATERHTRQLHKAWGAFRRKHPRAARVSAMEIEADAWLEFIRGHADQALDLLRKGAASEEFGVDSFYVPIREQLGAMLLELHKPAEALEVFEASLKATPGRFNSKYGAGRAAELTGQKDTARRHYGDLLRAASEKSQRPEVLQARAFLAGEQAGEPGTLLSIPSVPSKRLESTILSHYRREMASRPSSEESAKECESSVFRE